ncbi:MAG: hypothetical protein ACXAC7_14195 [Candidatus Hodarchaeales archaeon]
MPLNKTVFPMDKYESKGDYIVITLIESDGLPIVNLGVSSDLSKIEIKSGIPYDTIRYAGLSSATIMLFNELSGQSHLSTVMEGESNKVVMVSSNNIVALTIVPFDWENRRIVLTLKKAINYWLNH